MVLRVLRVREILLVFEPIRLDKNTDEARVTLFVTNIHCADLRRREVLKMRQAQRVTIGCGTILSLLVGCGNSGTGGAAGTGGPIAGSFSPAGTGGPTAGSAPKAGTGSTLPPVSGTGGGIVAGSGSKAGSGATAGSGTTPPVGGSGGGTSTGAGYKECPGVTPTTGTCKAKGPGVYAQRLDTDVWFYDEFSKTTGAAPLFSPGRGRLSVWFRTTLSDVCEDGSGGVAVNHPCGSELPPIYADASAGVAQIVFPDDLWDKPGIPDYTTVGETNGFEPGSTLSIKKVTGLLGIRLAATDGPFPKASETESFSCGDATGADCFTDPDGDMTPGVTATIKTDGTPPNPPFMQSLGQAWVYAPVPTSIADAPAHTGATSISIGLRNAAGGEGVIGQDCASGAGTADVSDFESRIVDCTLPSGACNLSQSQFVDKVTPTFRVLAAGATPGPEYSFVNGLGMVSTAQDAALDRSPSQGSKATVVRLGDLGQSFTCAQVRDAVAGK